MFLLILQGSFELSSLYKDILYNPVHPTVLAYIQDQRTQFYKTTFNIICQYRPYIFITIVKVTIQIVRKQKFSRNT